MRRLTAEGEADGSMVVGQAVRGAGMGRKQAGEAFTEDGLRAARLCTAETAEAEAQGEEALLAREVGDHTAVMAVDAVRRRAATGTGG